MRSRYFQQQAIKLKQTYLSSCADIRLNISTVSWSPGILGAKVNCERQGGDRVKVKYVYYGKGKNNKICILEENC